MYGSNAFICSQIIVKNPILNEDEMAKKVYFGFLRRYLNMTKYASAKYVKAQLKAYANILCGSDYSGNKVIGSMLESISMIEKYKYLLFFDLFAILGYDDKILRSKSIYQITKVMINELNFSSGKNAVNSIINAICGNNKAWSDIKKYPEISCFSEYIEYVRRNIKFIDEKPFNILITATMSAGKSTFINALTGKNVTLSQNTACTSKIHNIVGKPFEDGFICEYDHDIVMNAGREELLNDNEHNKSGTIYVSAYYDRELGGKRIVLRDTPGVNSSENDDHKEITEKIIKSKKYKLMLYLLNATQLGTNDDELHLEFVSKNIGRTPIIFIMNKADAFESTDGDLESVIEKQRAYLKKIGFKEPIICPVSSRIGYLCKKSADVGLSRMEMLELSCGVSHFEENSLAEYYKNTLPDITIEYSEDEIARTLKNCGIAYVEKIIGRYCR